MIDGALILYLIGMACYGQWRLIDQAFNWLDDRMKKKLFRLEQERLHALAADLRAHTHDPL